MPSDAPQGSDTAWMVHYRQRASFFSPARPPGRKAVFEPTQGAVNANRRVHTVRGASRPWANLPKPSVGGLHQSGGLGHMPVACRISVLFDDQPRSAPLPPHLVLIGGSPAQAKGFTFVPRTQPGRAHPRGMHPGTAWSAVPQPDCLTDPHRGRGGGSSPPKADEPSHPPFWEKPDPMAGFGTVHPRCRPGPSRAAREPPGRGCSPLELRGPESWTGGRIRDSGSRCTSTSRRPSA